MIGETRSVSAIRPGQLYTELWASLATMLRSYTALHGLKQERQAAVEADSEFITVRHGEKQLVLKREGTKAVWRGNDAAGDFEIRPDGSLDFPEGPVEMDMKAEEWARELMQ